MEILNGDGKREKMCSSCVKISGKSLKELCNQIRAWMNWKVRFKCKYINANVSRVGELFERREINYSFELAFDVYYLYIYTIKSTPYIARLSRWRKHRKKESRRWWEWSMRSDKRREQKWFNCKQRDSWVVETRALNGRTSRMVGRDISYGNSPGSHFSWFARNNPAIWISNMPTSTFVSFSLRWSLDSWSWNIVILFHNSYSWYLRNAKFSIKWKHFF